jgi:hypothetical protein
MWIMRPGGLPPVPQHPNFAKQRNENRRGQRRLGACVEQRTYTR